MRSLTLATPVTLLVLQLLAGPASAQVDARLFRYPDVSADRITFVYAGDVWVAPREGGTAVRLSSPAGEESFPRFSPDGSRIAYSGNYDGNLDVYVVPTLGGEPTRVTWHPIPDRMIDWDPDGESLLYASSRESGKQRWNQFYRVRPDGRFVEKLPLEHAEFGALSPDGRRIAFMQRQRDTRTWKRYRGGWAPDIHVFDLATYASENVTDHPANDGSPMWAGDRLYFLSDRGPEQRFNLWARDADGTVRQVTDFDAWDITYPAIGPRDIVFQAGGRLYLFELATEETREVAIDVVTDRAALHPRMEAVGDLIQWGDVSATGQRAVFEARGDIFTVPAEHGPVRNLTRTPGVAERLPSWSPDGVHVAYWSDASGEYELVLARADGTGEPRTLTSLGAGFRYAVSWSPDSERAAFVDQVGGIRVIEVATGAVRAVEQSPTWLSHGPLQGLSLSWSPDGRWLTWAFSEAAYGSAVRIWDAESGEVHRVTSGFYNDTNPVFGTEGTYLYLFTARALQPVYSALQGTWIYPNATQVAAIPLRADVPSPLAPRSDDEPGGEDVAPGSGADRAEEADEAEGGAAGAEAVEIDFTDFERRLVVLPAEPGNYAGLAAAQGKVVYHRQPRAGATPGSPSPLVMWDPASREEKTIVENAGLFRISADGKKVLVRVGPRLGIVDLAPGQKVETPLRTDEMEAQVDPRAEWRQMYADAWRMMRDYFYDGAMHGVDWPAIREAYAPLIEDAVTRWDVNFVIGEMIAEVNSSHTYRGGGDTEAGPSRRVGLLGVDWELRDGAWRIRRIVRGAPWDNEVRSPLDRPGVDVAEGDFVLAVNGRPVTGDRDPWAAFDGLAGETVTLTVASDARGSDPREVLVETLADETRLRNLEWIERNRQRVDALSGGRVGYVYVPSTGIDGQTELLRMYAAQIEKEALIIDERFNNGGQIPDRFVELLNRPANSWWVGRYGEQLPFPNVGHQGPKAMLINGWAGSGGDAFPYYFRHEGLGPLIGTRTWGGLIGISGNPALIDGGSVSVPTFRMYGTDGEWFAEGHGVEPDIEVPEDPTALARGEDPQIERAVRELLRALEADPVVIPARPAPENRRRGGGR
ncbi:MAG: PDZ domain-containing protein [Longimicrobiales bacterium]|nr:PDZ domain-containing protein [Longimicrobiales bacterium]